MKRAAGALPRAIAAAAVALVLLLAALPAEAAAATGASGATEAVGATPVGSTDLIENAGAYDGLMVVFEGEAIGDRLVRGDHAWVNVSDGANAVGVWAPTSMLAESLVLGRYGVVGDRLRIVAVFHRACPEHGGDFDLHAVSVEVVAAGGATARPVPWTLLVAGPGSFLLVLAGAALSWKRVRLLLTKT